MTYSVPPQRLERWLARWVDEHGPVERTERLQPFADLGALEAALDRVIARELAVRLERRPGQKEERYAHRLSDELEELPAAPVISTAAPAAAPPPAAPREDRLDRLEREVAELREELTALRAELGA